MEYRLVVFGVGDGQPIDAHFHRRAPSSESLLVAVCAAR